MAAINVTKDTHAQIKMFAYGLMADEVATTIGDVGDHLWDFVKTRHLAEFDEFVRKDVAARQS